MNVWIIIIIFNEYVTYVSAGGARGTDVIPSIIRSMVPATAVVRCFGGNIEADVSLFIIIIIIIIIIITVTIGVKVVSILFLYKMFIIMKLLLREIFRN